MAVVMKGPPVAYRPMTRAYIRRFAWFAGLWGLIPNLLVLPLTLESIVIALFSAALGAYFGPYLMGWVFWRIGVYRYYPAYLD